MNTISVIEIKSDRLALYKQFFLAGLVSDEESFRMTLADDANMSFPTKDKEDSFTLGVYSNNELAGVVSFAREGIDREKMRHKGLLFRMLVSKNFRGQGIANILIEALLERVKKIDSIEQISLTVIATNKTAKTLYEKFGFVTFSVEYYATKWKGKYFTEEQMVLRLK
jgi:ribosomal protein S18 acetylase RimI-like enzyme